MILALKLHHQVTLGIPYLGQLELHLIEGTYTCNVNNIVVIRGFNLLTRMLEAVPHVRKQLQCIWKSQFVSFLFAPVMALTPAVVELPSSKGRRNRCLV